MYSRTPWTVATWSLCIWFLVQCTSLDSSSFAYSTPTSQPCSTTYISSTPIDPPNFLADISPAAGSVITLQEYTKSTETFGGFGGVYAVIEMSEIVEAGDHIDSDQVKQMVSLCIDGVQIDEINQAWKFEAGLCQEVDSKENILTSYLCPYSTIYSPILLNTGEHIITIGVHKTSGAILKYSWMFTITP